MQLFIAARTEPIDAMMHRFHFNIRTQKMTTTKKQTNNTYMKNFLFFPFLFGISMHAPFVEPKRTTKRTDSVQQQ